MTHRHAILPFRPAPAPARLDAGDGTNSLGAPDRRVALGGKERSFVPGHDEEAWALNRRGHFAMTAN